MISIVEWGIRLLITLITAGFIRPSKDKRLSDVLTIMRDIYHNLNELCIEVGAMRILVLKTKNGGGLPRVGAQLYSSVLYESRRHDQPSIQSKWQERPLNAPYVEMLTEMLLKGHVDIKTEDIEDPDLRAVYEAGGVKWSRVIHLINLKDRMLYLSVNFDKGSPEDLTAYQNVSLRARVTNIISILKQNRKYL